VTHLVLALTLFAAILWTALGIADPVPISIPDARRLRQLCRLACVMAALTIVAGGFTAGLKAGLIYNTFPLMDGHLIPRGYSSLHPALLNLTENVTAVQFNHRLLATLTALTVLSAVLLGLRTRLPGQARAAILFFGAAMLLQYGLGVATLLSVVAVPLALAHQATAFLLFAAALTAAHTLRGAK
jgi:cytochrome c oxidase assembly protein subunit 15